jgi:pyruvate/2-oxoglutarate dehydrogenase complex dihydrolipoamide dehydrogenase (E3) component
MQSQLSPPPSLPDTDDCPTLLEELASTARRNPRPALQYNLVILGGGPAGIMAARSAAVLGAKVALIEHDRLGGTCLNTGCIPSKAILKTSRLYADMRNAEQFGGQVPPVITVDFAAVMARMRHIRERLRRRASAERLSTLGIDVYFGKGYFAGRNVVEVDGQLLRFKKALIAT